MPSGRSEDFALGVPDPMPEVEAPHGGSVSVCACTVAERRACPSGSIDIAGMLARVDAASNTVMFYEAARFHEQRYREHGSGSRTWRTWSARAFDFLSQYDEARRYIAACKAGMAGIYETTPVIVVPAATGPAPFGLASTGDAR